MFCRYWIVSALITKGIDVIGSSSSTHANAILRPRYRDAGIRSSLTVDMYNTKFCAGAPMTTHMAKYGEEVIFAPMCSLQLSRPLMDGEQLDLSTQSIPQAAATSLGAPFVNDNGGGDQHCALFQQSFSQESVPAMKCFSLGKPASCWRLWKR